MNSNTVKKESCKKHSFWIRITALWLLASLACTLPGHLPAIDPGRVTPTSGVPLPFATSGPKAEILPPILVETDPPPDSDIPLRPVVTFYFSQGMVSSSVEDAITFQPPLEGKFTWLDNHTVQFVAGRSLSPGSHLEVILDEDARADNGLTLVEPVTLFFQAGDSLLVADQLPKPDMEDVDPSSALAVTFNRPVVVMNEKIEDNLPAFSIQPEPSGLGEWINPSSFVFYPDQPLVGGTRYTITLNPKLTSLDGAQLALEQGEMMHWAFTTIEPEIISWTEESNPLPLDAIFNLTFNQPVDMQSIEERFSLVDSTNGEVSGVFSWNEEKTNLAFKPNGLLKRGLNYSLQISAGGRTSGGANLGQFKITYRTMDGLSFEKLDPPSASENLDIGSGPASFAIEFSSLLAEQNLPDLITLNPPVQGAFYLVSENGRSISVTGDFKPDTSYVLDISPALKDKWGQDLGTPLALEIKTGLAQPALYAPMLQSGAPIVMVLPGDPNLQARATNVENVTVETSSLSLQDFILLAASGEQISQISSSPDMKWDQRLQNETEPDQPVDIRLSPAYTPLKAGFYYYKITGNAADGTAVAAPPTFLAVSSQTHLLLKRSKTGLFIWAVGLASRRPLRDVEVSVYNGTFSLLGKCMTDQEGICRMNLLETDPTKELYAVMGKPGSPIFGFATTDWSPGVDSQSFGIETTLTTDPYDVYLYTDRSAYHPGEAVNFRALLRQPDDAKAILPALTQVRVKISGPQLSDSQGIFQEVVAVNLTSFGTATGTYQLPQDAPSGQYILEIEEHASQKAQIQVMEYQKQAINLKVEIDRPELWSGEVFKAVANASYSFGLPLKNLDLSWRLYSEPLDFKLPNGYLTGSPDYDAIFYLPGHLEKSRPWVQDGKGKTDAQGNLVVTVPSEVIARLAEGGTRQNLTLQVTLEDASISPQVGTANVVLHPSNFYIAIRPETQSFQSGREFGVSVQTVDSGQQVSGGHPLSASFQKITWDQNNQQDPSPQQVAMDLSPISAAEFITDEHGRARLTFIPPEPGIYELRLNGGGAETRVLVMVNGSGSATWPDLPDHHLFLSTNAESFKPGQIAHIFVANPFHSALALLTIEKDEVLEARVFSLSDSSLDLPISLDESDTPNVYVSLTLLGNGVNGKPDFRQGYLDLKVLAEDQLLQVEMLSYPEKPEPGDEVTCVVRVTDREGTPVQTEYSLSVVDKDALFETGPCSSSAETPFYPPRPSGIMTSMTLAANTRRNITIQNQGETGFEVAMPGVEQNFIGTAYWNGSLETDNNGLREITFTLPDSLVSWVAQICLVSGDGRTAGLRRNLVVSEDLTLNPHLPRFLVAGDHVELAADVINNTDKELIASVTLEMDGMLFDDPSQAVQEVDVAAGEKQTVTWWTSVQDANGVDLAFSVRSDSLPGSVNVKNGHLPVLRYTAPMTYAASGIISSGGEKVEMISLPRSFTPDGGELQLEMETSLAGTIITSLDALEAFPPDFPEVVISRLLPNLAANDALQMIGLESPSQKNRLRVSVKDAFTIFSRTQNEDGGWGWMENQTSDPFLSAYILLGLVRAQQAGLASHPDLVERAMDFIEKDLQDTLSLIPVPNMNLTAFQLYVLSQVETGIYDPLVLYAYRGQLAPWAVALLALTLESSNPGSAEVRSLMDDLERSAQKTASGVHWEDLDQNSTDLNTDNFTTAAVLLAFARVNPDSPMIGDAIQYLITNRSRTGGWSSSYETAWVLLALAASMQSGDEPHAAFPFSASLNSVPAVNGRADGGYNLLPVMANIPLNNFQFEAPNTLKITRTEGEGNLYYRADLQVSRQVEGISAITRGMTLDRRYLPFSENCANQLCRGKSNFLLSSEQPLVQVRLSLTIPHERYYVVVEDIIPAGAEIVNPLFSPGLKYSIDDRNVTHDFSDPFAMGWGTAYFSQPQIFADHIRWAAPWLPAGTYELSYLIHPYLAGDFHLLPARAYTLYVPDSEGQTTAGVIHFSR